MCQSMGLHRASVKDKPRGLVPTDRRRLARRVWWCCLVRDRWLAFIKGRPMRIDLDDCDMPFPTPSDVADELDAVPHHVRERCIPYSSDVIGELWCKLVKLSILLGRVLKLHSKNSWRTDAEKLEKYEVELQKINLSPAGTPLSSPYEQFISGQVRLHYEYASRHLLPTTACANTFIELLQSCSFGLSCFPTREILWMPCNCRTRRNKLLKKRELRRIT